jgi:hypothetical protein
LQQVQAERQRDQDTNFQLLLQADEIKVKSTMMLFLDPLVVYASQCKLQTMYAFTVKNVMGSRAQPETEIAIGKALLNTSRQFPTSDMPGHQDQQVSVTQL